MTHQKKQRPTSTTSEYDRNTATWKNPDDAPKQKTIENEEDEEPESIEPWRKED